MAGGAVGLHRFTGLGQQRGHLGATAGTGDARLAVGDQVVGVDQPGFQQRQKAKLHRGGIAAGDGDQAGLANLIAADLGQAVDGFLEQTRGAVRLAVPVGPDAGVAQPEVG